MKTLILKKYHELCILILGALLCFLFLLFRTKITGSFFLTFLIWNLFLATIPYGITFLMQWQKSLQHLSGKIILGVLWLLFLPNAPYIISDLQHIIHSQGLVRLYDTLLISAFAVLSLFFMSFSVKDMIMILKLKRSTLFLLSLFILCGFGIYLGRYLRWNSWDVIQNPTGLMEDIYNRLRHPIRYKHAWWITVFYASISLLFYKGYFSRSKLLHFEET